MVDSRPCCDENKTQVYTVNKASWCAGCDDRGQHFEKWRSVTASYDNKTGHFVGKLV